MRVSSRGPFKSAVSDQAFVSTGTELLNFVRSLRDTVCPQRQFSLFRFDGFVIALRKRESQWGDLRVLEK